MLLWLGLAALLVWRELAEAGSSIPIWIKRMRQSCKSIGEAEKGLLILASLIFGLSLIQALSPPWGYDVLMYHLQAPRLWLEAGRLTLLPDIWRLKSKLGSTHIQ